MSNDPEEYECATVRAGQVAMPGFDSPAAFRVATHRQTRPMTETDWQPEVLIKDVQAKFDPDGTLREDTSIEVRADYNEINELRFDPDEIEHEDELEELSKKYDPGDIIDTEYRNGASARLRYDVTDGVARLSEFKDAAPESAGWVSFDFLRGVMAAQEAVANVPGVDRVEDAPQTLGSVLMQGEDAEITKF